MPPASAMDIRSAMPTGCIANATAACPSSTSRIERTRAADAADEIDPLVRPDVADLQQRRQHLVVQARDVESIGRRRPPDVAGASVTACHCAGQVHGDFSCDQPACRLRVGPCRRARSASSSDAGDVPREILHDAMVWQDLRLVTRETRRPRNVSASTGEAACSRARSSCRARIALAAR